MKKSIWGVCALLLTACVAQRHSTVTSEAGKGKETIDSLAPNPFIRHMYTADPSAHVWADGRLYVYASHDIAPARGCDLMDQYHVFSTDDMVHWTDHGEILRASQVPWGRKEGGFMWAPDCAYKDGTYYFYFPHPSETDWNGSWKIGVATSKEPAANFTVQGYIEGMDPLIDPCVFVDDDGQAYIYNGGGGTCKGGRLKDNMMELDGAMRTMEGLVDFHEATWIHKYNGKYYLSYSDNHEPGQEGVAGWNRMHYAISDHPLGPWKQLAFTCSPPVRKRVSPTMAPSCSTKASGSPFTITARSLETRGCVPFVWTGSTTMRTVPSEWWSSVDVEALSCFVIVHFAENARWNEVENEVENRSP